MKGDRFASLATAGLLLGGLVACAPPRPPLPEPPAVALTVQPAAVAVTVGHGVQFGYRITSQGSTAVTWKVVEPEGGRIDPQGRYQAPDHPGTWTVEVRSLANPAQVARARVTVVPPPKGPISAPPVLAPGTTDLRASVPDQPGSRYAWSLEGGTILSGGDASSLAFRVGEGPRLTLRCRVTNAAGDTLVASQEIPVSAPVRLRLAPAQAVLTVGRAMTFGYRLSGDSAGVVWRVPDARDGTVDGKGTYRAPEVPGIYLLQAVPKGHPEQEGEARIRVVPAPVAPITAPDRLETGQAGCRASVPVQPGATYAWEVRGGTLVAGAHEPVVTFTVGQGQNLTLRCTVRNEAGDAFTGVLVIPVGR